MASSAARQIDNDRNGSMNSVPITAAANSKNHRFEEASLILKLSFEAQVALPEP